MSERFPDLSYRLEFSWPSLDGGGTLTDRIEKAKKLFPFDILVVHRDAEREPPHERQNEIELATAAKAVSRSVALVPVRMSEAWLLSSVTAIRAAANNPNGRSQLNVPKKSRWENLPDPKQELFNLLKAASELTGRRLQKFDVFRARNRVAELTDSFEDLRGLPAFDTFELALFTEINSELTVT